jgi:hypothetical protein
MLLDFVVIFLSIEFILALACLTSCTHGIYKKSFTNNIPYQATYLMVGISVSVVRMCLLIIFESSFLYYSKLGIPELCPFINPNWRIVTILLSFYEIAYIVLYFSRFKYLRAVKTTDKILSIVTQSLLYLIPIMFIVFLYMGNSNGRDFNITPYLQSGTITYLTHRLPEAEYIDLFLSYVYIAYFVISIISLRNIILYKSKTVLASYGVFMFSIIIKRVLLGLSTEIFGKFDHFLLSLLGLTLSVFFVLMIFTGRYVLNGYNSNTSIKQQR